MWAFILLLAIFSFLPTIFCGQISPFKHLVFLLVGFIIIYFTHYIDYKYFGGIAVLALPFVIILLILTMLQGHTLGGQRFTVVADSGIANRFSNFYSGLCYFK